MADKNQTAIDKRKDMSDQAVLFDVQDNIGIMTLNRADNLNRMTDDLLQGVKEVADTVNDRQDVRCLIVQGSGNSFCGGADFQAGKPDEENRFANERQIDKYNYFLSLLDVEVPIIASMNGDAIGGGLGLALVCDLRVADQEARYGAAFVKVGMHPGMATTYLLPRFMGVPKAMELLVTGRIITGKQAEEYGLVNYAVEPEKVLEKSLKLAGEVAEAGPLAVRWTKKAVYDNLNWQVRQAAWYEAQLQSHSMQTDDFKEGVSAFLENRQPIFNSR